MSWQCTSWALREAPAPTANARLVLIALADRCGPTGRRAWPTIATLAQEAHCSKASVQRALKALEESGCIRRGDQSHAVRDEDGRWLPPQYRPVVWECCMNVSIENSARKPGRQAREERIRRGVEKPSEQEGKSSVVKMSTLENVENKPKSSVVKMSTLNSDVSDTPVSDTSSVLTSDTPIKETNIETNTYPSVPTGHLPASGEPSTADEGETETRTTDVESEPAASMPGPGEPDLPSEVLDALDLTRSRLGLPVERPTDRDRRHAGRLVKRVAEANHGDTVKAMTLILAVIDWMPSHPFWLRRVTNGRSLAANWTSAASDYTVDQLEARQRHEAEARGSDKPKQPRKATPTPHAYTPQPHSDRLVAPIFGLRTMTSEGVSQSDIDAHFAGATCLGECPVCRHDPRNRANHGVTASQEAGSVRSRKDREA